MPETTTASAGATPVAAGATPAQTTPVSPTPTAALVSPATGDPEALGEAGKKALDLMKSERNAAQQGFKAAQAELETLRAAGLSESEKAIKEATNAATAAERAKWQSSIRAVRVEAALRVAGATNETLLDLALRSDLIVALKVDDAGKVTDLDKAVEQLKKDIPEMFASAGPGTVTRGVQTGSGTSAKTLEEAVAGHYSAKR
jgi:predicted  nucleic acid-binding Zn-ribbon protein